MYASFSSSHGISNEIWTIGAAMAVGAEVITNLSLGPYRPHHRLSETCMCLVRASGKRTFVCSSVPPVPVRVILPKWLVFLLVSFPSIVCARLVSVRYASVCNYVRLLAGWLADWPVCLFPCLLVGPEHFRVSKQRLEIFVIYDSTLLMFPFSHSPTPLPASCAMVSQFYSWGPLGCLAQVVIIMVLMVMGMVLVGWVSNPTQCPLVTSSLSSGSVHIV